jgi:hypothetical protein
MAEGTPLNHSHDESNPHLGRTVAVVDLNVVNHRMCRPLDVSVYHWGFQLPECYNIVCFLHIDDKSGIVLVACRPRPTPIGREWTAKNPKIFAGRLSSEVTTKQFVGLHTSIPVPSIIHHSVELDRRGGIGSQYIIMTKGE